MSPFTTADDLCADVASLLDQDPDKPQGLTVLDHPELPLAPGELPVAGVYLTEGERVMGPESSSGSSQRTCTVRVEIRAMGNHPLRATRAFRDWVLATVLKHPAFQDRVEYQGFQPFGAVRDKWMGGALMDFEFTHSWRP
jgi:hypothetical protein